jgi:hypothetical protein
MEGKCMNGRGYGWLFGSLSLSSHVYNLHVGESARGQSSRQSMFPRFKVVELSCVPHDVSAGKRHDKIKGNDLPMRQKSRA